MSRIRGGKAAGNAGNGGGVEAHGEGVEARGEGTGPSSAGRKKVPGNTIRPMTRADGSSLAEGFGKEGRLHDELPERPGKRFRILS